MTHSEMHALKPGDVILVQRPGHKTKVRVHLDEINLETGRFSGVTAADRRISGNLRNATRATS